MSRRRQEIDAEERERRLRAEQWQHDEAILDRPLTRRELIEALDETILDIGGSGMETQDLICDAFRKLRENLTP